MGKQSRRKKGGKNNKEHGGGRSGAVKSSSGGDSTLLQRIRHSDPRTRHAALAALSNTLLDPNSLFHSKRKIQVNLLQAIRERIMDVDLECAQAAAGCLANYISFGGASSGQESITASWTVVLTERLATCHENLKLGQQQRKNQKQWWALTMQCLHALCSLVETNPEALERLTKSNSVRTLMGLLDVGVGELVQSKHAASVASVDISYQEDVVVYVARTMHSALDDNPDLVKQCTGWEVIQECCTNQALPVACRLHCAGCLVTARLVGNDGLQGVIISTVIPVLHALLVIDMDELSLLANNYTECHKKAKEEEADDALEREVIRKVNERNEPARQIARRQKAMKEKMPSADRETIVSEECDEDTMQDDETTKVSSSQRDDAFEIMEKARAAWNQALSPIELALEITANLTGLAPPMMPEMMNEMDMEAEWGLEQEEMLSLQQQMVGDGTLSPLDEALARAIVESQIPNRLVALLKASCVPLKQDILADILDGMQELQSKCGACVGNCVGKHFPNWTHGLLQELRCALEASNGNPSIANAMAAALRSQSDLRQQCQPSELEFLLTLASSSSSPCQKEAVEMLGILCSMEPHPSDVNEKVCLALMGISSKKPAILNEVLNALMDMYGDDECHPSVFQSLNVLAFFQRTTPSFKKYIQCDRDDATEEEIEQWKETALNSLRFLSYKKGKL